MWSVARASVLVLVVPVLQVSHAPVAAGEDPPSSLSIVASQDTEVRVSSPNTVYGNRTLLAVDGDPLRQTFLKFDVTGIGDRPVSRVRLRMYNLDSSRVGGRVFAMSSSTWQESSTTWNTRPAIDGAQLGAFGKVSSGSWYEVDLPASSVSGGGIVSLAVDSVITDGAQWSSRESGNAPTLVVDLAAPTDTTPPAAPTLTEVAGTADGASDPTFYGNNHRLAQTAGGRLLAVYGRHGTGVQLAWQDPGRRWSVATTGSVPDGLLLSGTGTGDWPASVAVVGGASGPETAVVVWSGQNFGRVRPLQMRVLQNLDAPGGPDVGPLVTLAAPALGAARGDLGVEVGPDGNPRVLVTWTERTSDTTYALMVAWLDDPLAVQPQLTSRTALVSDGAGAKPGTVVTTPLGVRVAARAVGGRLQVFGHDRSATPTTWWKSGAGPVVPAGTYPSAVGLASGDVVVAASRDLTQGLVTVQRFSGAGQPPSTELEVTGYAEPAMAVDGSGARLVAIRAADGYVISRYRTSAGTWEAADRVVIGPEGGGNHSWPSAITSQAGGLRFVIRGPGTAVDCSSVLAYQDPQPGTL